MPENELPNRVPVLRKIALWFDTTAAAESKERGRRVDWVRVVPFAVLHLGCLGVLFVEATTAAVVTCVALYFVRMFAITGFYHRYFSHRAFRTSRAAQFAFAVLGNSAAQRGPLWWAAHHRRHHRHADTPDDVHSPRHHGFLWSHVGWITSPENFRTDLSLVPDLARYPELRFLDRFDALVPLVLAAALFLAGGWTFLFWGFFVSTVALFHGTCLINSLAHRMGTRRYETADDSRNSFLLALVTLGEGWHNNHHHYPAAARQGFRWHEIDVTYYLLRLLARLSLVSDLKPVPTRVVRSGGARPRARAG